MRDFAESWAEIPKHLHDRYFPRYPEEAIADWYERLDLTTKVSYFPTTDQTYSM